MSSHLKADLDDLHRDILSMCAKVEDLIHSAVAQLSKPSLHDARELTAQDNEIDRWDVQIEDKCLKILALHQPVAIDLRRITTVLKISGELERVADLAVNIVERAVGLLDAPELQIPDKLVDMAQAAVDMLHDQHRFRLQGRQLFVGELFVGVQGRGVRVFDPGAPESGALTGD